jgi:hypothetical protein
MCRKSTTGAKAEGDAPGEGVHRRVAGLEAQPAALIFNASEPSGFWPWDLFAVAIVQ